MQKVFFIFNLLFSLTAQQPIVASQKVYQITDQEIATIVQIAVDKAVQKMINDFFSYHKFSFEQLIEFMRAIAENKGGSSIINVNQSQNADVTSVNKNEHTNVTTISVRTYFEQAMTFINPQEKIHNLWQLICENKYRIAGVSALALYGALFYQCVKCKQMVQDKSYWHNWKQALSLKDLYQLNIQELSQSLLLELQRKYFQPGNPGDYIYPLAYFSIDIQKELDLLERYKKIVQVCLFFHITKLLPITKDILPVIEEKIERLYFIQNLFTNHMAQQNYEQQNTKNTFGS